MTIRSAIKSGPDRITVASTIQMRWIAHQRPKPTRADILYQPRSKDPIHNKTRTPPPSSHVQRHDQLDERKAKNNRRADPKENTDSNPQTSARILFSLFFHTKEAGWIPIHHRFPTIEQTYQVILTPAVNIQAITRDSKRGSTSDFNRSEECILPSCHGPNFPELLVHPCWREIVQVQGLANGVECLSFPSPQSTLEHSPGSESSQYTSFVSCRRLPLLDPRRASDQGDFECFQISRCSRVVFQIRVGSSQRNRFRGHPPESERPDNSEHGNQEEEHNQKVEKHRHQETTHHQETSVCSTLGPATISDYLQALPTSDDISSLLFLTQGTRMELENESDHISRAISTIVQDCRDLENAVPQTFISTTGQMDSDLRRIEGSGRSDHQTPPFEFSLCIRLANPTTHEELRGKRNLHMHNGDKRSGKSQQVTKDTCPHTYRQHHSKDLHSEVPVVQQENQPHAHRPSDSTSTQRFAFDDQSFGRKQEHDCRPNFEDAKTERPSKTRKTDRESDINNRTDIWANSPRLVSTEPNRGRLCSAVGNQRLDIPTARSDSKGAAPSDTTPAPNRSAPGLPGVDPRQLVRPGSADVDRESSCAAKFMDLNSTWDFALELDWNQAIESSNKHKASTDIDEIFRRSEKAQKSELTRDRYARSWNQFTGFCRAHAGKLIGRRSHEQVAIFAWQCFESTKSKANSINTILSAISAIHDKIFPYRLADQEIIKRVRAISRSERPNLPRYTEMYDVTEILENIYKNMENQNLSRMKLITIRTVISSLLLIDTSARMKSIASLPVHEKTIRFYKNKKVVMISFYKIKNSRFMDNLITRAINIPCTCDITPKLCTYHLLQLYLSRSGIKQDHPTGKIGSRLLFPVTKNTLANHFASFSLPIHLKVEGFKTHSVRSASISTLAALGWSRDRILRHGNWSSQSGCYNKHYFRLIQDVRPIDGANQINSSRILRLHWQAKRNK